MFTRFFQRWTDFAYHSGSGALSMAKITSIQNPSRFNSGSASLRISRRSDDEGGIIPRCSALKTMGWSFVKGVAGIILF